MLQFSNCRSSQFNVAEVRKDIAAMEEEKEQLSKRIQRLQRKASSMPKQEEMLEAARNLRKEKDRLVLREAMGMHQMPTIIIIHYFINELILSTPHLAASQQFYILTLYPYTTLIIIIIMCFCKLDSKSTCALQ